MNYNYKYILSGLDCANCARKIEDKLNKNESITEAHVNFSRLTVTVTSPLKNGVKKIVVDTVKSIEPDVKVLEENENDSQSFKYDLLRLGLGIVLSIIAYFISNEIVNMILITLAYLILLYRVFTKAVKMLFKNFSIDENLLVTISCVGAYFTNYIHEGLMVIILYEIGKILEQKAVNNSRKSISELMNIKADYANLLDNGEIKRVNPESLKINDIIVVKQGEKIPVDGLVEDGSCYIDNRALTGESKLIKVDVKDKVLSGSINSEGLINIKVTKTYENSTVSQILSLVENATDKKAKTENFVSSFAKIYTPVVLILAILIIIFLPIFTSVSLSDALYRALVFLVISCPCAIAISVPLSYFSGIGASSKKGILIKGSDYLEAMSNIKEIVFDKTGTITTGESTDYELKILDKSYKKEDVIKYYISGEIYSNHIIAKSIINIFKDKTGFKNITNFKEIAGKGITYKYKDETIKIGSSIYCKSMETDDAIYLNINGKTIAKLRIFDGIKENAESCIHSLKKLGIKTKMFTGDAKDIALKIGNKVGIDEVHYELLPQDKYNLLLKDIEENDSHVAFVGDGINDAPSLRIAGVGISMGSIGSDAAVAASDIVILNDDLKSILSLIKISKKTNRIIKENLIFAIGTKILVMVLSFLGITSMWQAVFADTGVTLLTILNTIRILKIKNDK